MTISEKSAYLKGLADGLKLDRETAEGRLIGELIDLVSEIATTVETIDGETEHLSDYVDELDQDLGELEEYVFSDDCDLDCCDDDDDRYDNERDVPARALLQVVEAVKIRFLLRTGFLGRLLSSLRSLGHRLHMRRRRALLLDRTLALDRGSVFDRSHLCLRGLPVAGILLASSGRLLLHIVNRGESSHGVSPLSSCVVPKLDIRV